MFLDQPFIDFPLLRLQGIIIPPNWASIFAFEANPLASCAVWHVFVAPDATEIAGPTAWCEVSSWPLELYWVSA